jgi:spore germination protein GerM
VSTRTRSGPVGCLLVMLLLALGLAACGIPKDGEPRVIAEEPGLTAATTPVTNDPGGSGDSGEVSVFFVNTKIDDPVLVGKKRAADQRSPIEAVIRLLGGTTPEEEADSLISRIPRGTELLMASSSVDSGLATLDLSAEIADIAGPNAVQAYAQLVYTATQYSRIAWRVRFLVEGEPDNVPTLNGGDRRVVTRSNYEDLKPGGP